MKARHVVMYGTTSAFFNSLMIKLNLYLCPLVSCVLKSEKNIEVSTSQVQLKLHLANKDTYQSRKTKEI